MPYSGALHGTLDMIQHPFSISCRDQGQERGKDWFKAVPLACPCGAQSTQAGVQRVSPKALLWSVHFLRHYPGATESLGKALCWNGWAPPEASKEEHQCLVAGDQSEMPGKESDANTVTYSWKFALEQALRGMCRERAESSSLSSTLETNIPAPLRGRRGLPV